MTEYTFTAYVAGLPPIVFTLDLGEENINADDTHESARSFLNNEVRQGVAVYDESGIAWTLTPDARVLGISTPR